jgi:quinoprotein glucose dehydrogenase
MAKAKELVDAAKGARVEFTSPVSFMNINFAGGSMTASAPPWSEMVKYDLNTGDIVWRIPTGVQEAPAEYNIPNNTGVQFPRNAPLVTAGGLIFLAVGPERKLHAYDRDNGKELWQHSLPNGAEGMPATYQVNGRQFVVLPVAQTNGTFPATFRDPAAPPPAAPPPGQGRGGGTPALPGAYIAFALPQ